jgi:cell fate (sporulation/competence/biofilm development) regulator YlbF (YheA/YmcA/DUF963 family)
MDIETNAKQLGRLISQTPEYKYYDQATKDVNENKELSQMMEKLQEYESKVAKMVREGETLTEEFKKEYSEFMEKVQGKTLIQALIASQENYLKLMRRVNDMIAEGIREGAGKRIITDF